MVVGSEWRLTKALREAAISGSTLTILTEAVVAQVLEDLSAAPTGLGTAFADLAVTGRRAFRDFVSTKPQEGGPIEAAATARLAALGTSGVTPALISNATSEVLDRAYQVTWFLRAQTDRGELGWIAVSGEDDLPHRPVNVPRTAFPQHDQYFTVPSELGEVPVQTRFAIATAAAPPAPPPLPPAGERSPPPVLEEPKLPDGDRIILFINGSDSRLEEANDLIPKLVRLPNGRPSGFSVISLDLPGSGYASLIDHTDVGPWNPTIYRPTVGFPKGVGLPTSVSISVLPFMESFIIRFVAALSTRLFGSEDVIGPRIAAVVGGSLGGNLVLRLARRSAPWLGNVVAWDPGSAWRSLLRPASLTAGFTDQRVMRQLSMLSAGISYAIPEANARETAGSRDSFFAGVFDQGIPPSFKSQPEQWYRDDWPAKQQYITMARLDRRETYTSQFRRWHWRVSLEEVMWTWRDPAEQDFKSRILLGAGRDDDISPAFFFTNTAQLAAELEDTDGDTFFFDHTGHSVHTERPEALAHKIMAFLGRPASTGWTHFQIFQMPTKDPPGGLIDYLFAYKAGDGTATFHEIPSDLQNTNPVWEGTWRADWTNLQIFPMNGTNYLFAYAAGDRTVAFDEIPSDLQDTNRVWESNMLKNWTHFQIFPWGSKNFLFSFASGPRNVAFDEIHSDLQGMTTLWESKMLRNWTHFQIFPWGSKNFLYSFRSGPRNVAFDEIHSDLKGMTTLWESTFLTNWTHFQIFPWGGKNFLYSFASGPRNVALDEIHSDLQSMTTLWESTFLKNWTHFQIFPRGGKNFLFSYASGDGTAAFDEIPSDLKGMTPVWKGKLTTG
jgi:pimeloyl-ACP methyl ester carboxylesterase